MLYDFYGWTPNLSENQYFCYSTLPSNVKDAQLKYFKDNYSKYLFVLKFYHCKRKGKSFCYSIYGVLNSSSVQSTILPGAVGQSKQTGSIIYALWKKWRAHKFE